jgi:hypothetical protein
MQTLQENCLSLSCKLEDNSAHQLGEYPGNKAELAADKGKDQKNPINISYNEGIFVGYRWHDTKKSSRYSVSDMV